MLHDRLNCWEIAAELPRPLSFPDTREFGSARRAIALTDGAGVFVVVTTALWWWVPKWQANLLSLFVDEDIDHANWIILDHIIAGHRVGEILPRYNRTHIHAPRPAPRPAPPIALWFTTIVRLQLRVYDSKVHFRLRACEAALARGTTR